MPAKGERNQSYYPSCWLNLANNPSIDAASYLNEATLGHQMEEPTQRKLMKSSVEKRNRFNYKTCCQGYYSV